MEAPGPNKVGLFLRECWYWITNYTLEDQINDRRAELNEAMRQIEKSVTETRYEAEKQTALMRLAVRKGEARATALQYAKAAASSEKRLQTLVHAKSDLQTMHGELARISTDIAADQAMRGISTLLERYNLCLSVSSHRRTGLGINKEAKST
jgi:hypothetical protein